MNDKINGRTPEEIYKALRCVITQINDDCEDTCDSCKNCPNNFDGGRRELAVHLADAIVRIQQLERERDAAVAEVESLNAEIDAINEDYLSGIHTVREDARPKWISVEERLPEEDVTVLVYRDGCCGVARLLDAEPEIMWTYTGFGGDPTHWMPLPEPPKEET